jgi:hypothetical protein
VTATNDFLGFANGGSANIESPTVYGANPLLPTGNLPGIASSIFTNTALHQANYVTSQLAQFICNTLNSNVQDNETPNQLLAQLEACLFRRTPTVTQFLSSTGTWYPSYVFYISSGNATAAATYTNNGQTFTVKSTISSGTILEVTGTGAPTVSGTLTKASGTGDATITFYATRSSLWLRARVLGGGASGGGGGVGGSDGTSGNQSTFGSIITCAGGTKGKADGGGAGGGGGAPTVTTGSTVILLASVAGGSGNGNSGIGTQGAGGGGGNSYFGGGGGGSVPGVVGGDAATNSGGGGGGGATTTTTGGGSGGGAGAFADVMILSPSGGYAWAVGASVSGGAGGTNGQAGGAGALGQVTLIEYWQ